MFIGDNLNPEILKYPHLCQATKGLVIGGKAIVVSSLAWVLLGHPLRTLKWAWTISTRLVMFAGLLAAYT